MSDRGTEEKSYKHIHKAAGPKKSAPTLTESGQPGIFNVSAFVQEVAKDELKMPQRLCTIDQMCQDASVSNSLNYRTLLAVEGMCSGQVKSTGTSAGDVAAEFIKYNFENFGVGTFRKAMNDAATFIKYGFAFQNIVMEKRSYGKYKNSRCIRKLAPRSQKSLYGWVWDDNYRELKGFVQKPLKKKNQLSTNGSFSSTGVQLADISSGYYQSADYPYIPVKDALIYTYNGTNNNPQGEPPALGVFESYLEKKIVEQYELSGLSKDLGGIIVARSPSDLFEKANDPENYPDAAIAKQEYEKDIADMHVSKTTFVHLQSDRDESGNYLYDFELKGVTGSGRSYDTTQVIKEKQRAIYNGFGTQSILLGTDGGGGSYALSRDQSQTLQYYVLRDMNEMADVINHQLIPAVLAANNIYLDSEDLPKWVPLNPFKLSYDEAGKFIQRVKSVGAMTKDMLEAVLMDLGLPTTMLDEIDFTDKGSSRAGESKGSSGTGDTQSGGASSEGNMENGSSIDKTLEVDGDKIEVDGVTVNADDLDEDGNYK